jgi:hypothetical protein
LSGRPWRQWSGCIFWSPKKKRKNRRRNKQT